MSYTLIDIFNNILKYKNKEIIIIIDNDNMPWFSAINIATILEYSDTKRAIINNVDKKDKKQFIDLQHFMKKIPKNAQPHALFINESGLFSLVLNSQKKIAKEFKNWITSEVLPSIRKTGSYEIEQKYKEKLIKINTDLKKAKKEIRILKHNQKTKNYKPAGLIYVLRPVNLTTKNLFKPGKTTNFNKRLNTYNTSVPNNMEVLFTLEVDDPDAVEHCMKGLLSKYIYRKNKEYYQCPFNKIKEIIKRCDNLVHDQYYCEKCQSNVLSLTHFHDDHQIMDDENFYLELFNDQKGGSDNEVLLSIQIDDPIIIERYCELKLYPHVDHSNIPKFECKISDLKNVLLECKQNVDDLDDKINKMIIEHNLSLDDVILIDIPDRQKGGAPYMSSEEFGKKIIVMDGGGMILPNGCILYPNGKVVEPNEKISKENHLIQQGGFDANKYNSFYDCDNDTNDCDTKNDKQIINANNLDFTD